MATGQGRPPPGFRFPWGFQVPSSHCGLCEIDNLDKESESGLTASLSSSRQTNSIEQLPARCKIKLSTPIATKLQPELNSRVLSVSL